MLARQQFDLLQCKLCNNIYEDPRLLDCLHSFCSVCLDSYHQDSSDAGEEMVTCPLCQEVTKLEGNVNTLPGNTLLQKYITQARKDKTSIVAGREVEKMSHESLTEAERKCPEIVASIQQLAQTAGSVYADKHGGHTHALHQNDPNTEKVRNGLKLKTCQLQVRAIDLVHGIDKVNKSFNTFLEQKHEFREVVKHRSMEIQDAVKAVERRILARIDDRDVEEEVKNDAFEVKNKLHKVLRSTLTMVDFLRLLSEYGSENEMHKYVENVRKREQSIFQTPLTAIERSMSFDISESNLEKEMDNLFGELTETLGDTVAWDPMANNDREDFVRQQPILWIQSESNDAREHLESYNFPTNIAYPMSATDTGEISQRHAVRSHLSTQGSHHKRHTFQKSMSFDTAVHSPYTYITSENQPLIDNALYGKNKNNKSTEFEILNETKSNQQVDDSANTSEDQFHKAIDTLVSRTSHPTSHRSRRVSAPPSMIIDALHKRRLSALSILERANINTEGLQLASDIETGMTEARQEWKEENVRRRNTAENSADGGV
ncbi:tripartite motif-containing protein 2-like isoform X2 [Mya arenaria]|uniref:tripartite motif-containing protein 2-like isoform X2 n=1 Tax=Mya arenaria TaxID=6604 RepID=UPI0022DF3B14|nr:tripartite motif-containing protein 2-like isoform X2 [Mya arenaria]